MSLFHDLKYIFKPSFWIMNESYSEGVEKILQHIIKNNIKPSMMSEHELHFDNFEVWIKNYPYAFGTIDKIQGRASRKTIEEFNNYIADLLI